MTNSHKQTTQALHTPHCATRGGTGAECDCEASLDDLQTALDEVKRLKAQNLEVARLILQNDRSGALQWAEGLVLSVDGEPDVRVELEPLQALKYTPGSWYKAKNTDDMQRFFRSRLPAIREAARAHGYAIGVHGSEQRDFDLIAMPWREGVSDPNTLACAVAFAACGITREGSYDWTVKPLGRIAVSIPVCWTDDSRPNAGHIDLSVCPAIPDLLVDCVVAATLLNDVSAVEGIGPDRALRWFAKAGEIQSKYLPKAKESCDAPVIPFYTLQPQTELVVAAARRAIQASDAFNAAQAKVLVESGVNHLVLDPRTAKEFEEAYLANTALREALVAYDNSSTKGVST